MTREAIEYRVVETREDLEGAAQLVYNNYVRQGYCRANVHHVYFYLFDALPETRTLVALQGGRVIATLTLVFDSRLGLPSGKLYSKELEQQRAAGRRMVEISKLSVDMTLGTRGIQVLRGLFRLGWVLAAELRGMTDFVVLVEPHHENFYVRGLCFDRIGELRPDPDASGAPSVLLRLDLEHAPDVYHKRFGDKPGAGNMYWFCCVDPAAREARDWAARTDERLNDLHVRLLTGRALPNPTEAESRYIDYRLFALEFNIGKVMLDVEFLARDALFRDAIGVYEKLLSVLPPNLAPERRARILLDIAASAWNCAMYDKAIQLVHDAAAMHGTPEIRVRGASVEGVSLYFQGRQAEALACLKAAAEIADAPPAARALVLRNWGRMETDRGGDSTESLRLLHEGWRLIQEAEEGRANESEETEYWARKTRWDTAFDLFVAEYRRGDMAAARLWLDTGMASEGLGMRAQSMFLQGYARIEALAARPAESLRHADRALELLRDPDSLPHSASILHALRAQALLDLGDLAGARQAAKRAVELGNRTRKPGMIADAAESLVDVCLAGNDVAGAKDALASAETEMGEAKPERAWMLLHFKRAQVAAQAGDWNSARQEAGVAQPGAVIDPLNSWAYHGLLMEIELRSGNAARAAALLPALREAPAQEAHVLNRQLLLAALQVGMGQGAESERSLELVLSHYRSQHACGALGRAAVLVLQVASANGSGGACSGALSLCRQALDEARQHAAFPLFS